MKIDAESARIAAGAGTVREVNSLCDREVDVAVAAAEEGQTLVACGQMAQFFADLWTDSDGGGGLRTVDIRDRAGWTDGGAATAKQAALIADAQLAAPATPTKDVVSEGVCLVLGRDEVALDVARQLGDRLAVTCLLPEPPEISAPEINFDLALGQIGNATGSLGSFEVKVRGFRKQIPGGRGDVAFGESVASATSQCDMIIDLRGEAPLFPAAHKREGYFRADPGDPAAAEKLVDKAAQHQGVFEKPLYIRFDAGICAHSRAKQSGCDRCLSVCPTGAIEPDGDSVSIDADICAGCGACAAVCPSGAASYDDPTVEFLFSRLRALSSTYRQLSDSAPRALFHDSYGMEMIALSARHGRGLPADVIPIDVSNVEGVGHAEILAALGVGFASVAVLCGPKTDMAVLTSQSQLAKALAAKLPADRIEIIAPTDPDELEQALYIDNELLADVVPILPTGGRREVTRLAATSLAGDLASDPLPLPAGAPYGAIEINTDACTLCLACVSLCPVGALGDSPEKPQVRFQETACLQCGICASTCPEDAIALVPQLDVRKEALQFRVLNEEEPFECIECGKPFGVKSTIERIVATLQDKHWMYTGSDNTKLIQMCDDCRVRAQYHQDKSPFAMGERPRVRTTDDYLKDDKLN